MKRIVVLCLVVATAAYAASAWSSPAAGPTPQRLQAQITALQKQVKKLQKDVKTADENAAVGLLVSLCGDAMTADALQGTWQVVDQVAGRTIFGPQTPVRSVVNNTDTCQVLQLARSQTVPPTTQQLQSLLAGTSRNAFLQRSFLQRK